MFGALLFAYSPFATVGGGAYAGLVWLDQCPNNAVWANQAENSEAWGDQVQAVSDWTQPRKSEIITKRCT